MEKSIFFRFLIIGCSVIVGDDSLSENYLVFEQVEVTVNNPSQVVIDNVEIVAENTKTNETISRSTMTAVVTNPQTSYVQDYPIGILKSLPEEDYIFKVLIELNKNEKCTSSRHRHDSVGSNVNHPELCTRCITNVAVSYTHMTRPTIGLG